VLFELLIGLVVKAFDGGFRESPVHVFDLPIGSRMLRFGAAMLDGVLLAGMCECMNPKEERMGSFDLLFC